MTGKDMTRQIQGRVRTMIRRKLSDPTFGVRAILIGLSLLLICVVLVGYPSKHTDLTINLVTECVGATCVAWLITWLIRWIERLQLAPEKRLLCARLLEMTDGFLSAALPPDLYKMSNRVYEYEGGGSYAIPMIEPIEIDQAELLLRFEQELKPSFFDEAILLQAKERLDTILEQPDFFDHKSKELIERLEQHLKRSIELAGLYDRTVLLKAEKQLGVILEQLDAFAPESKNLVKKSKRSLRHSIESLDNVASLDVTGWKTASSRQEFVHSLGEIVLAMVGLREWLEGILKKYYVEVQPRGKLRKKRQ